MEQIQDKFPVVLSQDLVWSDMDAFQHINNRVYLRYFEDARMAYFEKIQVMDHKNKTQFGPILAAINCNFRAPLSYPDRIQVATTVKEMESRRFKMSYVVYSEKLGKVAAEGDGLIVYYDYENHKSCPIPDAIRASINALQKGFE